MAISDEPRRSGRATKGQHKSLDAGDETPKPKKTLAAATASSTKKSAKKSAEPEPPEDEEEEGDDDGGEEEVVRCVCGDTTEKGPPDFVSCDACQVWQHNICMDLPLDEKMLPEHYMCEQCKPDEHKALLAAIERGEKPWDDRLRAWRNAKKRGKNRRKTADRQSTASDLKADMAADAASSSPAPAPSQDSGTKRKFEEEPSQPPSIPDKSLAQPSPAPSAPAPATSAASSAPIPAPAPEEPIHTPTPTPTPAPAPASASAQAAIPSPAAPAPANVTAPSSASAPVPSPAPTPALTPTPVSAPGRIHTPIQAPAPAVAPVPTSVPEVARRTSVTDSKRPEKRRKSSAGAKKVDVETELVDIEQLPQERRRVAEQLAKIIAEDINARAQAGSYRIPDGHTANSLGNHHAVRIEYSLYMNHGPFTGPKIPEGYAVQFRALNANLKRNAMLIDRMLKSDLTADELATMKPEDMASEEEQKKRAAMREEVQKQSVMVQEEDRPRVRRTHKGDEYVDDDNEAIEQSVFNPQPVRRRESDVEMGNAVSPTAAQPTPTTGEPDHMDVDKPATDGVQSDRRTSSKEFDIENVWGKTQHSASDAGQHPQTRLLQQPARRRSSIQKQTHQEKGEKVDADVDRMLNDDNDEDYAPEDFASSDGSVVWRGELIQPGVTQLTASGRFVAGNDFARYTSWSEFLPKVLEIEGRLEAKRADDYLCGLQWSKKSDVAVLALTPYNNRQAFDQIFEYFANRQRYAVIRKGHGMSDIVKDVYITPVQPGGPLPPHMDLLEHSSLDPTLPDRILLVTFVVNKPPHWDNPATAPIPFDAQFGNSNGNGALPPHLRNGPVSSPINTQPSAPAFSPREQGFTPTHTQNGAFPHQHAAKGSLPPNPYSNVAQPSGPTPAQYGLPQPYPQVAQPPHPNPSVARILGHLANAPTVQHILNSANGDVQDNVLQGIKDILTADPNAATDLGCFSRFLGIPTHPGH